MSTPTFVKVLLLVVTACVLLSQVSAQSPAAAPAMAPAGTTGTVVKPSNTTGGVGAPKPATAPAPAPASPASILSSERGFSVGSLLAAFVTMFLARWMA